MTLLYLSIYTEQNFTPTYTCKIDEVKMFVNDFRTICGSGYNPSSYVSSTALRRGGSRQSPSPPERDLNVCWEEWHSRTTTTTTFSDTFTWEGELVLTPGSSKSRGRSDTTPRSLKNFKEQSQGVRLPQGVQDEVFYLLLLHNFQSHKNWRGGLRVGLVVEGTEDVVVGGTGVRETIGSYGRAEGVLPRLL